MRNYKLQSLWIGFNLDATSVVKCSNQSMVSKRIQSSSTWKKRIWFVTYVKKHSHQKSVSNDIWMDTLKKPNRQMITTINLLPKILTCLAINATQSLYHSMMPGYTTKRSTTKRRATSSVANWNWENFGPSPIISNHTSIRSTSEFLSKHIFPVRVLNNTFFKSEYLSN